MGKDGEKPELRYQLQLGSLSRTAIEASNMVQNNLLDIAIPTELQTIAIKRSEAPRRMTQLLT